MDEAGERATDLPNAGGPTTVGARLREAREARGQTLDEIGKQTRIPVRHLVQIEEGRLEGLPAAPYSAGFVKAYARAVDLDPVAMSQQFRTEFAASVQASPRIAYEPYEPADPVRLPPRLLAMVALLIAVLLVAGYGIWRSGILTGEGADERARLAASGAPVGAPDNSATPVAGRPATPTAPASGAVVLTAAQDTWFEVSDKASGTRLYTGVLKQGQSWSVPPTAADPVIKTGRPEGLTVTVGGQPVAPLGEPAHTISNVSLKAAALTARPAPASTAAAPPTTATAPAAPSNDSAAVPPAFRAADASNTSTP
jgi:transcriptional regulator with XRE-family HTH domain